MEEKNSADSLQKKIALTSEQNACINYSGSRTLMIQGLAGAGKSVVIQKLAEKYVKECLQEQMSAVKNKVAIFTFNNTLNYAMKEELGVDEKLEQCVKVTTVNSYIYEVYKATAYNPLKIPYGQLYDKIRTAAIREALEEHKRNYGVHRFQELEPEFWLSEIDWMKSMNVYCQNDREYYLGLPRKGRGGKVRMSAADRNAAFQIFLFYDRAMKKKNQGDWNDCALYLVHHQNRIPEDYRFDHILVDEAQDVSLINMLSIMLLGRKSIVIAMDMNQRIFSHYWTVKQLGIEAVTKKLTKSMRTTVEIDALAESVRQKNESEEEKAEKNMRVLPLRHGTLPQVVHLETLESEAVFVTRQIKAWLEGNKQISIGVIAANKIQLKNYGTWMTDANIPCEYVSPDSVFSMKKCGVKLINAYNVKGLEFDIVIIPQFTEGNFPPAFKCDDEETMEEFLYKFRNLVYVSMTRARSALMFTYAGENGSRFIKEMAPELYIARGCVTEPELPKVFYPQKQSGFINWEGEQKAHYEDVLKYARQKQQKEAQEQFNKQMRIWFAGKLENPAFASLQKNDLIILINKQYQGLRKIYEGLTEQIDTVDVQRLWEDLWLTILDEILDIIGVSNIQKNKVMQIMLFKVMRLQMKTSYEKHIEQITDNRKYQFYINQCFSLEANNEKIFWKWLISLENGEQKFFKNFARCLLLITYFFLISVPNVYNEGKIDNKKWFGWLEIRLRVLGFMRKETLTSSDYKVLVNPLYDWQWINLCKELQLFRKIILFKCKKEHRSGNGRENMIEALYSAIDSGKMTSEKIESILLPEMFQQIEKGSLVEFPSPGLSGIGANEKLFFLDHGIYYPYVSSKECSEGICFQRCKGTLYFTSEKILFLGKYDITISYEKMERIIVYDLLPEILEFVCEGKSYFIQTATGDIAYKTLKLIVNRNRGKEVEQKTVPFTYEELVQRADLGACIFAFEYVLSCQMPAELYELVGDVVQGLKGLQKTLEQYPEHRDEIERFLNYYIPEAVRIVTAYQRYQETGIDRQIMNKVYERVYRAVETLDDAVAQKIYNIYQIATMNTIAQAEALEEILGQAGYERLKIKLEH